MLAIDLHRDIKNSKRKTPYKVYDYIYIILALNEFEF